MAGGEPRVAGPHTLHHDEDLTILNVIWAPPMILLPHHHSMCRPSASAPGAIFREANERFEADR